MVHLAYLMLLLPLAGFLFLLTFGRRIGDPVAGWIGTAAVGGSFVVACFVLARRPPSIHGDHEDSDSSESELPA